MKSRRKINTPMLAAGIMLCLCLLSVHLASGIYARYTVKATAEDNARVAKFEVDLTFKSAGETSGTASAAGKFDGTNDTAALVITNASEVAVRVALKVDFDADVKQYLASASLAAGTQTITAADSNWKNAGKTLDFGKIIDLAPGASAEYVLTLRQNQYTTANESVPAAGEGWKTFNNFDLASETADIPYVIVASYTQIN